MNIIITEDPTSTVSPITALIRQDIIGLLSRQKEHNTVSVGKQNKKLTKDVLHILLPYQIIHILANHWKIDLSEMKGTAATLGALATLSLYLQKF